MSGCCSEADRLFQILGPATENSCRQVECLFSEQWWRWRERGGAGGDRSARSAGSRRPGTMELICRDSYAPEWGSLTMMMTMMVIKIDYQLSLVALRTESISDQTSGKLASKLGGYDDLLLQIKTMTVTTSYQS